METIREKGAALNTRRQTLTDLSLTCEFHPFNFVHRVSVSCFYLLYSLSFAYRVNEGIRVKEPGIKVKVCYDVIPYVTTSVFPESHTSIIYIGGLLTAPQSLSYRESARPGKCSKSNNQRNEKRQIDDKLQ